MHWTQLDNTYWIHSLEFFTPTAARNSEDGTKILSI